MQLSKSVRALAVIAALLAGVGCQTFPGVSIAGSAESTRTAPQPEKRQVAELRGVLQVPAPLIGLDGATLIGLDGATLIGLDGATVQPRNGYRLANLESRPLPGARVFLADAAGQPIPSVADVVTDAQGRFVLPEVPVGLSYVVVGEAKTNGGKPAMFRSLVKVGPAGASTAVDAASTLVTVKVIEGLAGGELGNFNPATFQTAVETIARKLTKETLPDFTDLLSVRTKVDELVQEVADLRNQLGQLREELSRVQETLASPGAIALPGVSTENLIASAISEVRLPPVPSATTTVLPVAPPQATAPIPMVPLPDTVSNPGASGAALPPVSSQPAPETSASVYVVETLAGSGSIGFADGEVSRTMFNYPRGLAWGADDALYVADTGNHRVRRIQGGQVGTLLGKDGKFAMPLQTPVRVVVDPAKRLNALYKTKAVLATVTADGVSSTTLQAVPSVSDASAGLVTASFRLAQATAPVFQEPDALMFSKDGSHVYVLANHVLWHGAVSGRLAPLAGNAAGYLDGLGISAQFKGPLDVVWGPDDHLYVADTGNHRIRKVALNGAVTTFAGSGRAGSADGTGTNASFRLPEALAFDAQGNLLVADTDNHKIRKVSKEGIVTTIAGGSTSGYSDGKTDTALFNRPRGICVDRAGNIYVTDSSNLRIRVLRPSSP